MTRFYLVKEDNSCTVYDKVAVKDENLGWVAPTVETFVYGDPKHGGLGAHDAIEAAEKKLKELNNN